MGACALIRKAMEKTVRINGKDVVMRYCAATETGYEQISGKSSDIFSPHRMGDGIEPSKAALEDYLKLAISAIVAAYSRKGEEAPVTGDYIIYDATPKEINDLIMTVVALRNEWYKVPDVVLQEDKKEEAEGEEQPKNA